jgi:hypothetical protein
VSLVRGRFGVPTGGGAVRGRQWPIRLAGANFRFPESTLTLDGGFRIGDWQPDFDLMIQSRDASEIDRLFQNFMAATGGKPEPLGLGGAGEIQGHLSGTWANPDATVQISLDGTRYANVAFGSARGTVDMRDGAFYFRPLRVYDGDASLSLEGMARYRVEPGKPRFDLSLAARHYPLSRLLEYLDLKFPVDGQITGAFPISGTPEEVTGGGPVELAEGVVWGQRSPSSARQRPDDPRRFALEDVSADVGGGFVRGSGAISIKERTFEARRQRQGSDPDDRGREVDLVGRRRQPLLPVFRERLARPSQHEHFRHAVAGAFLRPPGSGSARASRRHRDEGRSARRLSRGSPALVAASAGRRFRFAGEGGRPLDAPDLASLLKLTPVELPAADGGSVAMRKHRSSLRRREWPSGKFTVTRARVDLGDRQESSPPPAPCTPRWPTES